MLLFPNHPTPPSIQGEGAGWLGNQHGLSLFVFRPAAMAISHPRCTVGFLSQRKGARPSWNTDQGVWAACKAKGLIPSSRS